MIRAAITSSLSSPAENKREAFGRGEGDPGGTIFALFKNTQCRLFSLTLTKRRSLGPLPLTRAFGARSAGDDSFIFVSTVP